MEQQAVIDFFDQAAAGWDAQLVRNEAVIGQILDNAGIRPGVSVLDVACGTGVLIPDYLERGAAQVTAIDIAPEMARIAREKFPQASLVQSQKLHSYPSTANAATAKRVVSGVRRSV